MKPRAKRRLIPFRNRNQTGWWVAAYLERFEWYDENKSNPNRRCLAWENTILVKARNRDEAYRKALAHGRLGDGSEAWSPDKKRRGAWRFEGLTSLMPVYDQLGDGAEILWCEYRGRSVRRIKSMIRSKNELEAFDDSE